MSIHYLARRIQVSVYLPLTIIQVPLSRRTPSLGRTCWPLIIHSPQENKYQKIPYSTDRVLMFQDYYYDLSSALLPLYLSSNRENSEPVPDGALINGAYM